MEIFPSISRLTYTPFNDDVIKFDDNKNEKDFICDYATFGKCQETS